MSVSTTSTLAGLLQWVFAILACAWALRTHKTRVVVMLVSVAGAVIGGVFMVVPLTQMAVHFGEGLDAVPYQLASFLLSSAILGMIVGVGGVVVQTLGDRRTRRA